MYSETDLKSKYSKLLPLLNEYTTRLVVASDALSMGRGGIVLVANSSGVSRTTITTGIKELKSGSISSNEPTEAKIRKSGGGRKKTIDKDEKLLGDIEELVAPHTMGNPMNPLRWTSKSFRKICAELKLKGHKISHQTTGEAMKKLGYSIQQNRKTDEGSKHEDRDAQFLHINETAKVYLREHNPVISVDCKKKELIGNFKNAGGEWQPKKNPIKVNAYDFVDKELGKAIPYGVYEPGSNEGYISVGISRDTAAFAVASIRSWWYKVGKERFSNSTQIYITADGGGSNSSRGRLWKSELQNLSNETGLEIAVSHYPPGTSKWNKIEHKLFSYISINWRGKPLTSLQFVIDLISSTTTETGLKVKAKIDKSEYQAGIKITDEEMLQINMIKNEFHGEWNYIIKPNIVQVIS
jgi:Rhodopirellula transposase DDE domain